MDLLTACRSVLESLERNLAPDFLTETRQTLRDAIHRAEGNRRIEMRLQSPRLDDCTEIKLTITAHDTGIEITPEGFDLYGSPIYIEQLKGIPRVVLTPDIINDQPQIIDFAKAANALALAD